MTTSTRCTSICGRMLVSTVPSKNVAGTRRPSSRISVRLGPRPRRSQKISVGAKPRPLAPLVVLLLVCAAAKTGSLFSASGKLDGAARFGSAAGKTKTGVGKSSLPRDLRTGDNHPFEQR